MIVSAEKPPTFIKIHIFLNKHFANHLTFGISTGFY